MLIHLEPPPTHLSASLHTRPPLARCFEPPHWWLGGPGLHPLLDYVWAREEGEEEVQDVILLTIPVTYGERTGLSTGTVGGVAGPACLSTRDTFYLKLIISGSCVGSVV